MDLNDFPKDMRKKSLLFRHFAKYLTEKHPDESLLPSLTPESQELNFVKKWLKTSEATLFRLSTGVVQANFIDKTIVFLSAEKNEVIYQDREETRTHYFI